MHVPETRDPCDLLTTIIAVLSAVAAAVGKQPPHGGYEFLAAVAMAVVFLLPPGIPLLASRGCC